MRRTKEQLELDAVEANRFREQRRRLETEMTPDRVERLESAVYGSTYTNPEVTASIGLSDVPIDARLVHEHTARRALETGNASNNRENLVKPRNRAMRPTQQRESGIFTICYKHQILISLFVDIYNLLGGTKLTQADFGATLKYQKLLTLNNF